MSKSSSSLSSDQLALLRQLKQQVSTPAEPAPAASATAPSSPSAVTRPAVNPLPADDASLFSQAMQGVKPIKAGSAPPRPARPAKPDAQTLARRLAAEGTPEQEGAVLSDMQALLNPVNSEAFLSYRIATLQHRIFEDLKAGKLRWYEAVDLHGCTIEQARDAVIQIISMACAANETVIKIVHGKGEGGVLKTCVNGWLRQHPQVLAFVSAPAAQGGTGSVLVLLKRTETAKRRDDDHQTRTTP